jgi:flavoprotein
MAKAILLVEMCILVVVVLGVIQMICKPKKQQVAWNWLHSRVTRSPGQEPGLEECRLCHGDFVNPVDWEPLHDTHWWMLLRCGACDTWREVTVTNAIASRYDLELDRRLDTLARALDKLDRKRMVAEVETMIQALRHDLVDAADFAQ